jgi:hypothetical protein
MATIERLKNPETGQPIEGILLSVNSIGEEHPVLFLEVVTSETITLASKVTQHPVEDGSQVSDHITKANKKYSLKVIISDATLLPGDGVKVRVPQVGLVDGLLDKLGFISQFKSLIPTQKPIIVDRPNERLVAQTARVVLEALRDNKVALTLRTSSGDKPNVVITSVKTVRDSTKSIRTFEFDLMLEQLQIVAESASVRFLEVQLSAEEEAALKVNGNKGGKKALASELVKGLKGLVKLSSGQDV